MSVVLLSTDLAVQSRVEGAVLSQGKQLRVAARASQVAEICRAAPAEIVIVDLATSATEVSELMTHLRDGKSAVAEVVAFGPHVHEQKLAAAREAGCDVVLSRGQFFSQLANLLSR
jgi:DNA-binding response OmpR family regulator